MSSNAIAKAIPKPPTEFLRKPLQNYLKKHLIIASVVGVVSALAYKYTFYDSRKRNYKQFYA